MCRCLRLGTALGKTQALLCSSGFRVLENATRVEKVGQWIALWCDFAIVTTSRIRRVWRKVVLVLASDHQRWNKATVPISTTRCAQLRRLAGNQSRRVFCKGQKPTLFSTRRFSTTRRLLNESQKTQLQVWKKVAGRTLGKGMESGTTIDFARKTEDHLIKESNCSAVWRTISWQVVLPTNLTCLGAAFCARCDRWVLNTRNWDCPGNNLMKHFFWRRTRPPHLSHAPVMLPFPLATFSHSALHTAPVFSKEKFCLSSVDLDFAPNDSRFVLALLSRACENVTCTLARSASESDKTSTDLRSRKEMGMSDLNHGQTNRTHTLKGLPKRVYSSTFHSSVV